MSCKFDERIIHLYADGELGETARARVEEHLSICDDCRIKYKTIMIIRQELATACIAEKAPGYLATRIKANLDNIDNTESVSLGVFDRFRMMLMNFKGSKAAATAFAFGLVLMFVLFPGEQGLSSMAGELAQAHVSYPDRVSAMSINSESSEQVGAFLSGNLGIAVKLPQKLSGDVHLTGARIVEIDGMKAAHAYYADNDMQCSLFIFQTPESGNKPKYTMRAADREYEIGSSSDVNFICWHEGQMAYVLCGCCCFDKLTQLATSGV